MAIQRRELLEGLGAMGLCALSAPSWAAPANATPSTVSAYTQAGTFIGQVQNNVNVWRGIPVIENPYQSHTRFQAPIAYAKLTRALECFSDAPLPLQPSRTEPTVMVGGNGPLCLHIYAPRNAKNAPVMVWIPGGGSTRCDPNDPRFNGTRFAQDGVILVVVSYRVNLDGFIEMPGAATNRAIRDVITHLQWVQKNIVGFGGDPTNVTIFGQSAGATMVVNLLASPKAQPLFKRAIVQSASALAQWVSPRHADRATELFAKGMNVPPTFEGLGSLSATQLAQMTTVVANLQRDKEWVRFCYGNPSIFKSVVGDEILPLRPIDAIESGLAQSKDVIIGCTQNEWRYYLVPNGQISQISDSDVYTLVNNAGYASHYVDDYRRAGKGVTPGDLYAQIQSDLIFRLPVMRTIDGLTQGGSQTYAYSFDWQSPVLGVSGARMNAAHTCDVPYVFGTRQTAPAIKVIGAQSSLTLENFMRTRWVAFAKNGAAPWDPHTLEDRKVMSLNEVSTLVEDPWQFERSHIRLP